MLIEEEGNKSNYAKNSIINNISIIIKNSSSSIHKDDDQIVQIKTISLSHYTTRCTLKLSFTMREDALAYEVQVLQAFLGQMQRVGDKKCFIAPQYNDDKEDLDNIIMKLEITTLDFTFKLEQEGELNTFN